MLERMQVQAVALKLAGLEVVAAPVDEPWCTIYERLTPGGISAMGVEQALWQAMRGLPDAHAVMGVILRAMPDDVEFPSLARLAEGLDPIDWLWPSWIPRGMLSLLGASPGAGKSLVALDLARRIIHGVAFPDGAAIPRPGTPVIYVDAEAVPQIQNARAMAWDLDRDQLYLMLPPERYGMLDLGSLEHQDRLIDMCQALQPDLVVVDSLSSITMRGENNVEDVRAILGFLSAVAREFDAGLLLVHHLRKRSKIPMMDLVTADDFRGSSHIIAMARSVLALSIIQDSAEPNRNGPRRMEIVKTNLCKYPRALGLVLDPEHPDAPTLRYSEDVPQPYREPTKAEECAAWLMDTLEDAGEPMKPVEVIAQAKDAGFTQSTLRRARASVEGIVVDTAESKHAPGNLWALED